MGDLIFGQRTIKLQLLSGFCKLSVVYVVTLQPNHTFLTGCPVALPPPPPPPTHTHTLLLKEVLKFWRCIKLF